MTPEAATIAIAHGADARDVQSHTARHLTVTDLRTTDLVLAMARDNRREIVEIEPAAVRRTFTVRELGRLVDGLSDEELLDAAKAHTPGERLASMIDLIGSYRGVTAPSPDPLAEDVVDPYRRSMKTYERSASQLASALPAVERVIRLATAAH